MQTSPYGGTTAVVFIPDTLLTETPAGTPGSGTDEGEETGEQEFPGGRLTALDRTPVPSAEERRPTPVLDAPVELEAPVAALDEDDDEGVISHGGASRRRDAWRGHLSRHPGDQHQQARDTEGVEATRPDGPVPLPRRRSPVLVSDRGRPVQAQGRHRGDAAEQSGTDTPPGPRDGGVGEPVATTGPPAQPTVEGTGVSGLPRRVRQASLAPQLKAEPAQRGGGQDTGPAEAAPERDADQVRARMGALQRGWRRGRAHTGEDTGSAGNTAPGNTSEGDGR
jgi:hypothetical protein